MSVETLEQFAEQLAQSEDSPSEEGTHQEDDSSERQDVPAGEVQDPDQPTNDDGAEPEEQEQELSGQGPADDSLVEWETEAGEKLSAPVSELKSGYMRNQDYVQKSQELVREREAIHQQVQQQYQQVEHFARDLGQLQMQAAYVQQLEAQLGQINRLDDPVAYSAATSELLMARQEQQALVAKVNDAQQRRAGEQQQALHAAQQQALQELSAGPKSIPGFGKEMVQKLNEAGRSYGLTDQELSSLSDARQIRILHDAMQYRALQARKPAAVAKVKQAPIKPPRQTAAKPPTGIEKDIKQLRERNDFDSFARLLQHTM